MTLLLSSTTDAAVSQPGLFDLQQLDWDTRFFGPKMGTLVSTGGAELTADAVERELGGLLDRARAEGYAHVIFRAPVDDLALIWGAEAAGLRLVDVGVDSSLLLADVRLPASDLSLRPAQAADVTALQDLAAGAFKLSRFAADPFFTPRQVVDFHREWVKNLCGGLAQLNLVADVDGQPAGFVSCNLHGDEARIVLIATNANVRRRGLGHGLVASALSWAAEQNARVMHVKTQSHNYPALGLYHRSGFRVSKTELTFSIALQRQASSQAMKETPHV